MDSDPDSVDDWVVVPSSSSSSEDQDSVDDWVVVASSSFDSDGERVIALSSGCAAPNSSSPRAGSKPDHTGYVFTGFFRAYAAAKADPDGMYALPDATPPPSPRLSGFFHHTLARDVAYAAFDPAFAASDISFIASFDEPVAALASTGGLVCLLGTVSNAYYMANPVHGGEHERLPAPSRDHRADGEPAVVITFDDLVPGYSDPDYYPEPDYPFYRHYYVVVAFPTGDGVYAFESFSSRSWAWTVGHDVADAEKVVAGSGVGVHGCAFWRTVRTSSSPSPFLFYTPVAGLSDLVPAPAEVIQWPYWELGEMEGTLCVTCMDARVDDVFVIRLGVGRGSTLGDIPWTLAGHFEGGCLRGRPDVKLLRSQGKAEVVMWDPSSETVVAMDIEGRTTRTISFIPGSAYYADFIPYVSLLAGISGSGKRAHDEHSDCK